MMLWVKQNMTVVLLIAALAASATSYIAGRAHQSIIQARKETKLELKAYRRAEALSIKLTETENKLRDQQRLLEKAANADPISSGSCFPAARVRRLNLR